MSNNKFHHEEIYRGKLDLTLPITVCGVGAVGSNLVENLARIGFTTFVAIDKDRVETHNINTQTYRIEQVGQLKTVALNDNVYAISERDISSMHNELTAKNVDKVLKGSGLIVDSFDNSKSRKLVYDYAKKTGTPCLHIGLFADYGEIVWNDLYRVPSDNNEDVCDYPLARNTVMFAVTIASEEIIRHVKGEKGKSYSFTLRDLKVTNYV